MFKEDAIAGGSSGEPKSVVWEERRRFQQFLGTRDASWKQNLMRPSLHFSSKEVDMSPDFVFTEGFVLTVLVDSATGSHPVRKPGAGL